MPPHELNALLAAIKAEFETRNEYTRIEFDRINEKLDNLTRNGCEIGRANKTEIDRIKGESEKRGTIGGTVAGTAASIIVAVFIGIMEWIKAKPQ